MARVARIVAAMKDFSHPGASDKATTNLNTVINNAITISRNEWKYVADLRTDFEANLPEVECMRGELSQVVLNLIINAAHAIADVTASGENGRGLITVSTRSADDCAEIRVTDTGTGIPLAHRDRIFESFFTTKAPGRGTGQGLALARNVVVERHEGTISFKTVEGEGTTFIVSVPFRARTRGGGV